MYTFCALVELGGPLDEKVQAYEQKEFVPHLIDKALDVPGPILSLFRRLSS
jgi:hypothetical protein